MSHRTETKTQIKNEDALERTCVKLGLEYKKGKHTVSLYDGPAQCDFSVKLPDWQYPVAINLKTGEATFDTYNGSWGDIAQFDNLNQEYGLQVAEREPDVQAMVAEGWQIERVPQKNGDVQLRLFK